MTETLKVYSAKKPRKQPTTRATGRKERSDVAIGRRRPEFTGDKDRDLVILLRRAGITLRYIAQRVKVKPSTVWAWEQGRTKISAPCLELLRQMKAGYEWDEADLPPSHFVVTQPEREKKSLDSAAPTCDTGKVAASIPPS